MNVGPRPPDPREPYPSVRGALVLTLLAILAAGFTGIAFLDFGLLAAVGVGQAIGVGAVATMAAQRVPEPQAERLGLRALEPEAIPVILCLIPAVLLASELDNLVADWAPAPSSIESSVLEGSEGEARAAGGSGGEDQPNPEPSYENSDSGAGLEQASDPYERSDELSAAQEDEAPPRLIDPDDPASVLQAIVVMVGISPIVEEFLFRGVIQQSLVQRLGLIRGISMVALLWTLLRPAPIAGIPRFLAAAVASFALGWALGIVRLATGSILGPILLASGWAAIGLASVALEGRVDLPGLNVPGSHLPILVTAASLVLVAWAGWTVYLEAARRFEATGGTGVAPRPREGSGDEAED